MIPDLPRVFVALPVYGGYHAQFVPCLARLIQSPPQNATFQIHANPGDSLVSRSRNRLAAQFLRSDCTHLLFLDTDLIFSSDQIGRLISHDLPLVCGLYPKKQTELAWVCNTRADFGPADPDSGLQRILYGGTGCMLIRRDVFEKIAKVFPDIAYDPDDGEDPGLYHDFFKVGVCVAQGRRRYLSEDWFFCEMAMQCGIRVMMDTRVVLKHVGEAVYPLQDPFERPPAPPVEEPAKLPSIEEANKALPPGIRIRPRTQAKSKTRARK